jgi:uncharacterized protein YjiS (DUF1127 family)
MIMSTTTSTTTPHVYIGNSVLLPALATLKRWWLAYMTWRIERAAIATLASMSDRDLNDLGIGRCGIPGAVKGQALRREY